MILQAENGKSIKIDILQRCYPESIDFEDGNWLQAEIRITTPEFQGFYRTNVRSEELGLFLSGLQNLHIESLENFHGKGGRKVEFTTMEDGLSLQGSLEENGSITWCGEAQSQEGEERLSFTMETGYSALTDLLSQTKQLLSEYPVVGTPPCSTPAHD